MSKVEKLKTVLEFDVKHLHQVIDTVEEGVYNISKKELDLVWTRLGQLEYVLRLINDNKHLDDLYKIITED